MTPEARRPCEEGFRCRRCCKEETGEQGVTYGFGKWSLYRASKTAPQYARICR
jgi:hypothetical protein